MSSDTAIDCVRVLEYICAAVETVDNAVQSDDEDVELLAVDSPLRSSNDTVDQSCRRRVGGILRLRRSSSDDLQLDVDDDAHDDALLSLEHQLTQSTLLIDSVPRLALAVYYCQPVILSVCPCV